MTSSSKRAMQRLRYVVYIAGFFQESNSFPRVSPLAHTRLRMSGNQDNRYPVIAHQQGVLQLEPTHTGHVHVGDQALDLSQTRRMKEIFRRSKGMTNKSE